MTKAGVRREREQKIALEKREMKWHAGYRGGLFGKQNMRARFHYAALFCHVQKKINIGFQETARPNTLH